MVKSSCVLGVGVQWTTERTGELGVGQPDVFELTVQTSTCIQTPLLGRLT